MADVFSSEKRSEVMSKIRSAGNRSTEQKLASLLRLHKISGWRRNYPAFGKPDFVFPAFRIVVFVDGCFWHSCPLRGHCQIPKTRTEWWTNKLNRTRARDRKVVRVLRANGWAVARIWEHSLAKPLRTIRRLQKLVAERQRNTP